MRFEVAAFAEATGADILLRCSGFIDLAVYYEGYLAVQDGEQDSVDEQYKDLIQSQNSEQDSIAEQGQDLLQPRESDLGEDTVKLPIDQVDKQTRMPAPEIIDELDL